MTDPPKSQDSSDGEQDARSLDGCDLVVGDGGWFVAGGGVDESWTVYGPESPIYSGLAEGYPLGKSRMKSLVRPSRRSFSAMTRS